jgi:hypothetical protein
MRDEVNHMTRVGRFLSIAGIAAIFSAPIASRADSTMGQLVYAFTYSANQSVSARDSANGAEAYGQSGANGNQLAQSSGISHYGGSLNDKGTMTVQLVHQQPDGALVVMISEQGQDIRRAPPAECVVYGNTHVICDPNKTVYTEEYTLLRFLGRNFVDPSQLDATRHWTITQDSGGLNVHADYVINSNNNGKMQISETRSLRQPGGGSLTTDIQTKVGYDFAQSLPTSVDEYVTQRHDNGAVGTSRTIYQTTLNLVSDSMAKT